MTSIFEAKLRDTLEMSDQPAIGVLTGNRGSIVIVAEAYAPRMNFPRCFYGRHPNVAAELIIEQAKSLIFYLHNAISSAERRKE